LETLAHQRRHDVSPVIVWSIIFLLLMGFAYYLTKLVSRERPDGNRHDTGLAIMEFGQAFPNEAIRSLNVTADGDAIFVRLHDTKAGFMKSHRNHYSCHLIEPGRVRVMPVANAKGFAVEFFDAPTQNGVYTFASEKEAAEVSLWLLDNYVSSGDRDIEEPARRALTEASATNSNPDRAS
jgi:hypothetical protein